jgi:hypothetical protein
VANYNSSGIGIENEGLYMTVGPTQALTNSLVQTLTWLCGAYGLNPNSALRGHRGFNATACPGDVLYAQLPELRGRVTQTMRAYGIPLAAEHASDEDGPTYPSVPENEPEREFYRGPARGGGRLHPLGTVEDASPFSVSLDTSRSRCPPSPGGHRFFRLTS